MAIERGDDLFRLEDAGPWLWTRHIGVPNYDFPFARVFACHRTRPRELDELELIARVGAFDDYAVTYAALREHGLRLVNSPAEHLRATRLPHWYPRITELTPKSLWFDAPPEPDLIAAELGWPMFMKGERQTLGHQRRLSIITGPDHYREVLEHYAMHPRLRWQTLVCRQLAPLRQVEDADPERVPSSYEFRTFWWQGELVGLGRYWWQGKPYALSRDEEPQALALARTAALRVDVPFLVVDIAQQIDGTWIVIECNDAQESGHAGVSALGLWRTLVDHHDDPRG